MKKKFILLLLIITISIIVYGQSPLPIKEHFDKNYPNFGSKNFDYSSCYLRGNGLSWTLSGLLRLYQATGDKAYLVNFINHCIKLQKARYDEINTYDSPVWVSIYDVNCYYNNENVGLEPVYFNSLIISAMAEFVYLVNQDQTLYNTPLPIQQYIGQDLIDINILQQMPLYGITINDFGHFAWWLGYRVEQTLTYMNDTYWDNSWGIKGHNDDDCSSNTHGICGGGMNWESPYGCALLYMGLTNTNFGYDGNRIYYLDKARLIASLYKRTLNWVECENTYAYPELRIAANNSYIWYTRALSEKKHTCYEDLTWYSGVPDISWYTELVEDPAHGATDLWFANACYEAQLAPVSGGTPYFTYTVMERFRNTLTKNLYYVDNGIAHFHNNVDGTDNPSQADCSPNCPPDLNDDEVLDWMPLYKFDGGSSPNAYDILIQHTADYINNPITNYISGYHGFLGFAEVVKAQWDKECTDLTLYNRDVTYNQNFFAKHDLFVVPQQYDDWHLENQKSFADPEITANEFIVENNTEVNMTAGASIVLGPGTHIVSGSTFNASIDNTLCSFGSKSMSVITPINNINNTAPVITITDTITNEFSEESFNNDVYQNTLSVNPNPFSGTTQIQLAVAEKSHIKITITDMYGVRICSITDKDLESGNYTFDWNASGCSPGIYFCVLETTKGSQSKRIILTN